MLHSSYISGLFIAAIFGWASWGVVVSKLSPFTTTSLALSLFYASLLIALAATFTLINYYLRTSLKKNQLHINYINVALRQGFLLAIMVNVALAFQRLKVLTWWNGLLLLAVVLLVEFYFTARE